MFFALLCSGLLCGALLRFFLALLASIFLSGSFSSLGLHYARAKGAQADHTVKTNRFLQCFNFRLRAGERRGKQKTNVTTFKNNTKKTLEKELNVTLC